MHNDEHPIDRIDAAARQLLVTEGVHAVSYRAVARAARVSVGTVAYYFESRADLLERILDRVHDELEAAVEPLLRLTPEQLRANLGGVRGLIHFAFEERDNVRLRIATWVERWQLSKRRNDLLADVLSKATAHLATSRWTEAERRIVLQTLVYGTQRFAASSAEDRVAVTGLASDEAARELIEATLARMVEELL